MTRLMKALLSGNNLHAATTFNKGKGASTPPPMIAPAPPVEEASVELDATGKKKARTGKSTLKMPLRAKDTGLKL